MSIQIKPIAQNQFTHYAKPEDVDRLASIYRWAAHFTERNIPFVMFENHNGTAIWKLKAEDCVCEVCKKSWVSHEGKKTMCRKCGVKILKDTGAF